MTLKLHIFWGFLTIYRIQQSYQECIEIKRRYDLNANFIDTIKIVLRDGNNTTFECNEGFIALKTLSNEVKCISKSEVRKDTGCDVDFTTLTPGTSFVLNFTFRVKIFQQKSSAWKRRSIPCIEFTKMSESYRFESWCDPTDSYSGFLIKMNYKSDDVDSRVRCIVFTVPGFISERIKGAAKEFSIILDATLTTSLQNKRRAEEFANKHFDNDDVKSTAITEKDSVCSLFEIILIMTMWFISMYF